MDMKLSKPKNSLLWLFITCLFILKATAADNPYWFLISINQTVTQTSLEDNGEPEKAVDGKVDPAPGTCSRTKKKTNPYFMIDFGREISQVFLRTFIDPVNVAPRYHDAYVKVGNNPDCISNEAIVSLSLGAMKNIKNNNSDRGRYLCIQIIGSLVLSLCEVFVFQIPLDSIAFKKPVTLSKSTTVDDTLGARLVDRTLFSGAFTDTMMNPWIRVDLLDTFFVREIVVIPYLDPGVDDFAIRIGSSLVDEGRVNPLCAEHQNVERGGGKAFFCRMKGRYVLLTKNIASGYLKLIELFVNPTHQENLAEGKACMTNMASIDVLRNTDRRHLVSNVPNFAGYITAVGTSGNWLRLDLGESLQVARILLENTDVPEYMDQMVDFELRVGDSMENDGNSNPLCLSGLQSMLGKILGSFYCEPPITGQYVNVNQKTVDKHLALLEIAVYSEAPPEIKDREKARNIWRKVGDNLALSCEAYGHPIPVVSWVKDHVVLNTGSNSFDITSASLNDSGTYECWANNTHGQQYKTIEVTITSELRPCTESVEIFHDLGATNVVNPKFLGNKWYRFYDSTARKYLQMSTKVPTKNSVCTGWINGGAHPGVKDGVIERNICVKENNEDCNRQFTVRIRNCAGFYIYNLLSSNEAAGFSYCFYTDTKTGYNPTIALMSKTNNALSNHVIHLETEINDSSKCLLMCSLTEQCQSFNFSNKEKICELNSSTKRKHPDDFMQRNGYNYYMKGKGLLSRERGDL